MSTRKVFVFCLLVVAGSFFGVANAQSPTFYRNLKLGDTGSDVLLLQKTLNLNSQTRISVTGPGSPGNETSFFGVKTRDAVTRFQEQYSSEVLAPVGLTRGSGFVGSMTRHKLSSLLAVSNPFQYPGQYPTVSPVSVPSVFPVSAPVATPTPTSSTPTASSNPNLVNLDSFLERVATVYKQRNISDSQTSRIINQIKSDALTKGDFKEEFFRQESTAQRAKQQSNSTWRNILIASFKAVNPFANVARAQGPAFGGPVGFIFPCTCSETAIIYVGPPSVMYLDYVYGTQAFLSYNLPYAANVLGLYTPGAGVTCYIYVGTFCTLVSSEGMVSTVVGSS